MQYTLEETAITLKEVLKDFARWTIAGFIVWFIANGYTWIMGYFLHAKITPPLYFEVAFTIFIKYLDYFWHRYQKSHKPELQGESLGLFRF